MSGDGGGFFNANSAHPFENPTPLTNVIEIILMLLVPVACIRMFGRMVGDGAADASYDNFTALGGGMLLSAMMLGEISPGGVGSGLYGLLMVVLVAVFLGGLMVSRTPEYLAGPRSSTRARTGCPK